MSRSATRLLVPAVIAVLALAACRAAPGSGSHARPAATATSSPFTLDAVFTSPTGLYTIRYNHTWPHQQVASAAGPVDYFKLPNATFAVTTDRVQPGTQLETFVQATLDEYHSANIQKVQRDGPIAVAGGKAELVHAVTYVDAQGQTVALPPTPSAQPHVLYQAFYLLGEQSFTFSIAWPQGDSSDYLGLFHSLLRTFVPAGTS